MRKTMIIQIYLDDHVFQGKNIQKWLIFTELLFLSSNEKLCAAKLEIMAENFKCNDSKC